jgi:hypothetical protein
VGAARHAGREEQEQQCREERGAHAGREGMQLGNAGEMPEDDKERPDRGDDQRRQVQQAMLPVPTVLREQERDSDQEKGGCGGRRRPAGKCRPKEGHVVREQEGVDAQITPHQVLGEHQHRDQDRAAGRGELMSGKIGPERQQAPAGEHEHEGLERHRGREKERGPDQRPEAEDVGLDRDHPTERGRRSGDGRQPAHPARRRAGAVGRLSRSRRG